MKRLLFLLMMFVSLSTYAQTGLQVETQKGITVVTNGADSLSVFGVTEAYDCTQSSFKVLSCVVPKGNLSDDAIESGICYSSKQSQPSIDNGSYVKRFSNSSRVHTTVLDQLSSATTYFYRVYVKYADGSVVYGKTYSSKTALSNPNSKFINGHEFVDLGLPSGLYWATCNVGAESETDDGEYYAWGETEPKSSYSWSTYKWGSYDSLSKYNSTDGKITLDAEDDAATVNWGEGCRMPSMSEFEELYNKCDWSWQTNYKRLGVNGFLVTGPNNNTIFLPASGCRLGDDLLNRGLYGNYWSSSLYPYNSGNALQFIFDSSGLYSSYLLYDLRDGGYLVRPVADK